MRRMFFKQRYLNYILEGVKQLEGRVGYDNIRRLKVGDYIYLNGEFRAKITEKTRYSSFREAITEDNYKLLIPDANSPIVAVKMYEKLFQPWKQEKLGVYIFRLEYPTESRSDKMIEDQQRMT